VRLSEEDFFAGNRKKMWTCKSAPNPGGDESVRAKTGSCVVKLVC
jgi:hypothetical protein